MNKLFLFVFLFFLGGAILFAKNFLSPDLRGVEEKETVIYLEEGGKKELSSDSPKEEQKDKEKNKEESHCEVDINSASTEELQKLTGVGPAYAKRIEEKRPFSSLNGLLEVSGIGEVTLENIKSQECATVSP